MSKYEPTPPRYHKYMPGQAPESALLTAKSWTKIQEQEYQETANSWVTENDKLFVKWAERWYPSFQKKTSIIEQEDLLQEIRLVAIEKYHAYDDHRVDVKRSTFLIACIENEMLVMLRKLSAKKRQGNLASHEEVFHKDSYCRKRAFVEDRIERQDELQHDYDDYTDVAAVSPEAALVSQAWMADVRAFIQTLPQKQRDSFNLWEEGMTQVQIAKHLDCAQSNVSYSIRVAQDKIRAYLEKQEKEVG